MGILEHIYHAKNLEYLVALFGAFSFIGFWRVLNTAEPITVPAFVKAGAELLNHIGGFLVPKDVMYHPGHAWVRVEGGDMVTVGLDDFASKLVGKIDKFKLPTEGTMLKQGQPAWAIGSDSKEVRMLAPVDGQIVAANKEALDDPQSVGKDPYGRGWLLKIKSPSIAANLRNLIPQNMVANWFENIREELAQRNMQPAMATMMQDGGELIGGIAKTLDAEKWDKIAEEFFMTAEK